MGAISSAIAQSARAKGAEILTNATVKRILYSDKPTLPGGQHQVEGVGRSDIAILISGCYSLIFAHSLALNRDG